MAAAASSSSSAAAAGGKLPPCGFSVGASKKGNLPVSVEKRPKGKKVTVISNVQGSAKSLLSTLSSLLGCGGTLKQESSGQHWTIEIQGDQTERVTAALAQLGCLKGVKKDAGEDANSKKKEVQVAARNCGYDKFLRRKEPDKGDTAANVRRELFPVPGAACAKWHGPWIYCRGQCDRADLGDVWADGNLAGASEAQPICPASSSTFVPPPSSLPELNLILRGLGMLAEVGRVAAASRGPKNPAKGGFSLADYRKAALGPGARLIDDPGPGKPSTRRRAQQGDDNGWGTAPRAKRPPPRPIKALPPPPKVGSFPCQYCGSSFGLFQTLKLHLRNVHGGLPMPRTAEQPSAAAVSAPAPKQRRAGGHFFANAMAAEDDGLPIQASGNVHGFLSPAPEGAAGGARRARPAPTAGPSEEWTRSACPVCGEMFDAEVIEAHVDACLAAANEEEEQEDESEEGDEDEEDLGEVCPVLADYEPSAERAETELYLRRGQKVIVNWRQPVAEGGYWAYGCVDGFSRSRFGYFPLDRLGPKEGPGGPPEPEAEVVEAASSSAKVAAAADMEARKPASRGEDGQIPLEWLETFLLLELPPASALDFWRRFEQLRSQGLELEAAWVSALGTVCSELPERATTSGAAGKEPKPGEASQPPAQEQQRPQQRQRQEPEPPDHSEQQLREQRAREQKLREEREQQQLLEQRAREAQLREQTRREEQKRQEEQRQREEQQLREQQLREERAREQRLREEQQQREQQQLQERKLREEQQQREQQQLRERKLREEQQLREQQLREQEKRQQKQEPKPQLQPQPEPAPQPEPDAAADAVEYVQAVNGWEPEGQEGGDTQIRVRPGNRVGVEWRQPPEEGGFWAYGWLEAAPDQKGYFPQSCLPAPRGAAPAGGASETAATKAKQASGGTAAAAAVTATAATSNGTAASKGGAGTANAATAGAGKAAGAAQVARPDGAGRVQGQQRREQQVSAGAAGLEEPVACPLCQQEVSAKDIGQHLAVCGATERAGGGSAGDAKEHGMDEETEVWARAQLASLFRRFCVGKFDDSVALTTLWVCASAVELRAEAVSLIADNQPVKNFAAELWRRKSAGLPAGRAGSRW